MSNEFCSECGSTMKGLEDGKQKCEQCGNVAGWFQ